MSRVIRQPLPDPPEVYDQQYFFRLVNALNLFMNQITAEAETTAARYICTAPVIVDPSGATPDSVPSTAGLPTGMLYFYPVSGMPPPGVPGRFFASIVTEGDT